MRTRSIALAMLLCCVGPLAAQEDGVAPGARVRVTLPAPDARLVGRVHHVSADSLVLEGPHAVSLTSIERLEASRGRPRLLWTAVGMAAGATAGVLYTRSMEDDPDDIGGVGRVADGLNNTLIGVLVGGALGFFLAPERWRTVR